MTRADVGVSLNGATVLPTGGIVGKPPEGGAAPGGGIEPGGMGIGGWPGWPGAPAGGAVCAPGAGMLFAPAAVPGGRPKRLRLREAAHRRFGQGDPAEIALPALLQQPLLP